MASHCSTPSIWIREIGRRGTIRGRDANVECAGGLGVPRSRRKTILRETTANNKNNHNAYILCIIALCDVYNIRVYLRASGFSDRAPRPEGCAGSSPSTVGGARECRGDSASFADLASPRGREGACARVVSCARV